MLTVLEEQLALKIYGASKMKVLKLLKPRPNIGAFELEYLESSNLKFSIKILFMRSIVILVDYLLVLGPALATYFVLTFIIIVDIIHHPNMPPPWPVVFVTIFVVSHIFSGVRLIWTFVVRTRYSDSIKWEDYRKKSEGEKALQLMITEFKSKSKKN